MSDQSSVKVWPTMYDTLVKMFDGIDSEEYKTFTATMHKMISNIRRRGIRSFHP